MLVKQAGSWKHCGQATHVIHCTLCIHVVYYSHSSRHALVLNDFLKKSLKSNFSRNTPCSFNTGLWPVLRLVVLSDIISFSSKAVLLFLTKETPSIEVSQIQPIHSRFDSALPHQSRNVLDTSTSTMLRSQCSTSMQTSLTMLRNSIIF